MSLKEQVGKNICKYRKLNHLTQEKLAERVGLEINSVSSFERGKYFPSPDNLVKIAEALNISVCELFIFKEEYTSEQYIQEINSKLFFLKDDTEKLSIICEFIKSIL